MVVEPKEALARLVEGNQRFVENGASALSHETLMTQSPFAIVLGCSDSRVPVEMIFDQGIGDLFIIRVAGNIVDPQGIGSVEFAVQKFSTKLIVVLGHSLCGAVNATLEVLQSGGEVESPNLASIVNQISPAVKALLDEEPNEQQEKDALLERAMRANVRASVEALQSNSTVIKTMVDQGELAIVGADYSIETGKVEFHAL